MRALSTSAVKLGRTALIKLEHRVLNGIYLALSLYSGREEKINAITRCDPRRYEFITRMSRLSHLIPSRYASNFDIALLNHAAPSTNRLR